MKPKVRASMIWIAILILVAVGLIWIVESESFVKSTFTHSVSSVGAGSALALAANDRRQYVMLQNDHATQVVYCKFGATAVLNQGIRINGVGGTVVIDTAVPKALLNCIATGATTPLLITEGAQ